MSTSNGFVLHGFRNKGSNLVIWLVDFSERALKNAKVQLVCHGRVLETKSVTVNYAEVGELYEPPEVFNIGSVKFLLSKEIKDNPDASIVVLIGEKKLDPVKI